MRKTLTLMLLALAASPLAACKMFWEHDDKPAAVASTTETAPTEVTQTDPAQVGPAKPEPAVMAETKPASPEQPTPAVAAKK